MNGTQVVFPGMRLTLRGNAQGDRISVERCADGSVLMRLGGAVLRLDAERIPCQVLAEAEIRKEMLCRSLGAARTIDEEPTLRAFEDMCAAAEEGRTGLCRLRALEVLWRIQEGQHKERPCGLMREVQRYLQAHVEEEITIAQLAATFHISPTHLKACFRCAYGMPLMSYARRMKMQRAAELLRSTDRKIADIGAQFGYCNASKFAAAFRSVMGVPPAEYRTEQRCVRTEPSGVLAEWTETRHSGYNTDIAGEAIDFSLRVSDG